MLLHAIVCTADAVTTASAGTVIAGTDAAVTADSAGAVTTGNGWCCYSWYC